MQDILNNRIIKTELVEWKKLIPFQPDNLKKTEPHKLQKLANSLCQNGFSMNFYVWEKDGQILIIDGHSRHEVLQLLESGAIYPKDPSGKEYAVTIPEKLPCSFLHLKNKTEAKKAVLIYNSKYKNIDSDILAEWVSDLNLDELKSQIEIPELKLDFDMPQELENDSIDDTAKIKTNIKLGDLIEIGRHRLLCGDSTKKEDVERLMNGEKAELLFTSPPYSDMREYEGNKDLSIGNLINFISAYKDFANYQVINLGIQRKNHEINQYWDDYILKAKECGYKFLSWNVWDRLNANSIAQMSAMFPIENEFIFVFGKEKKKLNQTIENKNAGYINDHTSRRDKDGSVKKAKNTLIRSHRELGTIQRVFAELSRSGDEKIHPARFPVELPTEYIKAMTNENDNVIEPFAGSGTTMVACQTLDRTCYGMELEPLYCQVIINRMRKNFPELEIKVNGKEYKES